jgi:methyltransferase
VLEQSLISLLSLAVVLAMMLAELRVSRLHERALMRRGAIAPADPVFGTMRWAYPAVFVFMALEGAVAPGPVPTLRLLGIVVFAVGKLLKWWAMATLGERWTFKVLVVPGEDLIARGPYRFMRHPNYVGVVGELVGMALLTGARIMGPVGTLFFCWLLWRRIAAEERALGLG